MTPEPGARVHVAMTKWGDRPHWSYDGTYLGEDVHGHWIGLPVGTMFRRPGVEFASTNAQVTLAPREAWWMAGFHGPGGRTWPDLDGAPVDVYVDMSTPATFAGTSLTSVDLDLDVIRGTNGKVFVDDEDEFAEHRVSLAYPDDVVRAAEESCASVLAAVRAGRPPFDRAASGVWMAQVAGF